MNHRRWARGTAFVAALASAIVLIAGCAGPAESPSEESLGSAKFQMNWWPSIEAGYVLLADANGHFADRGVDVELVPGGPEVDTASFIVSGEALMGALTSETLAAAVLNGAPLVAVAAIYQTSSSAIVTLCDSGVTEPKDLEGRKFGTGASDERIYRPFFEMTGVDADAVEWVNTGTDPSVLISGEVDAMSGVLPNQPVVLETQGYDACSIPLADYGYNRWTGLMAVRADSLEDPQKAAQISAMLLALRDGLQDVIDDPDAAGQTVADLYGEQYGLDLASAQAGARVWSDLATRNTQEQGLMRMTEEGVASQQTFFDAVGTDVTAAELYDLGFSDDVLSAK